MEEMFCFQCQQTAHNTGCEGHTGVCGKKSDTANLQDELTGELIRLARAVAENERSRSSDELMLKGLFTTITNVNFNSDTVKKKDSFFINSIDLELLVLAKLQIYSGRYTYFQVF